MLRNLILLVALGWSQPATPPGLTPEPRADYEARVTTIADAVASVAKTPEEAAAVLTIWRGESGFDLRVHAGDPHPTWTADHGRAKRLGQIWKSSIVPDWDALTGTDLEATKRCAFATLRVLRSASWMCNRGRLITEEDAQRAFALYGHGSRCAPTVQSIQRAKMWRAVVVRLRGGK